MAVRTCSFLGIGHVVAITSGRNVSLTLKESLVGKSSLGPETVYENILGANIKSGDQVIVIHHTMPTMVVNQAVLPISLLPEIRALREERAPRNPAEAVLFLTAISKELHWEGAAYYKAFPFVVQEHLASWVQSAQIDPASSPHFAKNQYLFGLAALLRGPRENSQEEAIRIMDEFWQLPETGSAEVRQWILTKLSLVFEMIANRSIPDLDAEVIRMLETAMPDQLAGLAQSLLLSSVKTPAEIIALRASAGDIAKIKEAALLIAWRHESFWSRETAKELLNSIRKLPGPYDDAKLSALETRLSGKDSAMNNGFLRPSLDSIPWGAGWAVESPLFDNLEWDKLEPYRVKTAMEWWMAPAILAAGIAVIFFWRRFSAIAIRRRIL